MHAVKLVALVIIFLLGLRAISWGLGWALHRFTGLPSLRKSAVANAASFGAYLLFLVWDRIPGDRIDPAAVVVGAVVYLVYFVIDLKWVPWKQGPGGQPIASGPR